MKLTFASLINHRNLLIFLTVVSVLYVLLPRAWTGDDAYITFRVVDNFVNGYGLRWNIDERVQAYSNPLWMFLHIPFHAVFDNIYLTTIGISFACVLAALITMVTIPGKHPIWAGSVFLLLILCSESLINFAVSGLETPLTLLLFALFYRILATSKNLQSDFYTLCLIAALCFVNRMDSIVILLPILAFLAIRQLPVLKMRQFILYTAPAWGWLLFALLYYGFIFPNTKYAKLGADIPAADLWQQGIYYLEDLYKRDSLSFITLSVLCLGTAISFFGKKISVTHPLFLLAIGIILQCLYIITIGGDFMSGRFFILPFFATACLLHSVILNRPFQLHYALIPAVIVVVSYYNSQHISTLNNSVFAPANHGIVNERLWYGDRTRLLGDDKQLLRTIPTYRRHVDYTTKNVIKSRRVGYQGFFLGPQAIIIDVWALCDPLLSRLPLKPSLRHRWRIGHFDRDIPVGYEYFRATGDMSKMDPDLAKYYEKLRLITAGDLLSGKRLKTIIRFNFGAYDHWLDAYIQKHY